VKGILGVAVRNGWNLRYKVDGVEEGREVGFIDVIEVPCITCHGALVMEHVVPVVTEFTTGTECGDKVLGHMDPKAVRGGELLLT